jgi:geranylgeranyl pyrophosphate synthase
LACAFGTIAAGADDIAVKEAIDFGKWIGIAY